MAFKGKATSNGQSGSGGDFPRAPAGNHPACLVAIVDLGTQTVRKFQSEETEDVHKVFLLWELVECPIPGLNENHLIGRDYRLSYHEKAALRLMMEGWRGKAYADGEEIDIGAALGRKCLLNVKSRPSKSDPLKSFPSIEGVNPPPRGFKISDPLNRPVAWELGENALHDLPAFAADYFHYGQAVKEWVEESKEWKASPEPEGTPGQPAAVGEAGEDEHPF